jgi:hypothetical protein
MLARLENSLGQSDLTKQMILIAPPKVAGRSPAEELNLIVGYNGSPHSQTALDMTLWIAHQTRLATRKQVTVQVVYVASLEPNSGRSGKKGSAKKTAPLSRPSLQADSVIQPFSLTAASRVAVAEPPAHEPPAQSFQFEQFEQADRILWQARHLAEEWRGSLKTHLRFGQVARELRQVVQAESGVLLVVGCESPDHAIVHQLGAKFPCPVLGIPPTIGESN